MSLSLRHCNRIKLFKFSERHSNFCLKFFNHLATACQTMSSLLRAKVSLRMIVFINSNDMSSNSSLSRTWFYSTIKCCFQYILIFTCFAFLSRTVKQCLTTFSQGARDNWASSTWERFCKKKREQFT